MISNKTTYITEVSVVDPDTGGEVVVEIWKDSRTGGIFGIDASFVEQVGELVPSMFEDNVTLILGLMDVRHKNVILEKQDPGVSPWDL